MLRRLSFSAALAALAVPVLLAGPAPCRPGRYAERRPRQRRPSCARSSRSAPRAEAAGEPPRQARPRRDRLPARGDHRQADPLDDPREGHGPGLRDGHQQRHRPLVDDQRLLVHLRRAADHPRPARRGSGHARGRRGRRPDHRRAAQGHHRGARAGRPRDVQPQHPAPAAPRRHPRRLLVRRARARSGAGRPRPGRRRPRPHLPPAGPPGPARPGADGRGDPAAAPARVHRRRLARRPRQLDPDPLPGRSAPLAGRLRGQLRRPHRDWVVDPALIDAVRRLADGNPPRSLAPNLQVGEADGEDEASEDPSASTTPTEEPTETPTEDAESDPGSPLDLDELDPVVQAAAQAAQAWLARLGEAMRPEDQVMSLPYGDVDVAAAAAHDPQLYERAVARAGTTLPGFDVTTTPVVSSPSGYLTAQADPGRRTGLDDPAHRHDVRGPGPGARRHRGPQRGRHLDRRRRGRPGPRRPDVDHCHAAAAAVGGRGAVPPRRTGRRSPWWSRTTGTPRTAAVRSSAASTRPGST